MALLETTQQLLRSCLKDGWTVREIANESGGTVNFEWLRKFADGTSKNPTIVPLQALHDHLVKIKRKSAA